MKCAFVGLYMKNSAETFVFKEVYLHKNFTFFRYVRKKTGAFTAVKWTRTL